MQFLGEVGILCGGDPGFGPLSADAHLAHVLANSAFRDFLADLAKLGGDFGSPVVLLGFIVDLSDLLLNGSLPLLGGRRLVPGESTVAGAGNA